MAAGSDALNSMLTTLERSSPVACMIAVMLSSALSESVTQRVTRLRVRWSTFILLSSLRLLYSNAVHLAIP